MNYNTVLYFEKNDIAYIYIDMLPANKMVPEFLEEIVSVIEDCALKTKMSGIIISGNGRHFSSGADIGRLMQLMKETTKESSHEEYVPKWYARVKNDFDLLYHLNIPIIAAINGLCIGSGFELALHTHLQIAEKNARVGLPETTFGLLPGIDGTIRCIEKIGYKKAFEIIMKGELIAAEEALEYKLVDYIVPKKAAISFAEKLIHFIMKEPIKYQKTTAQSELKKFLKICEG